MTDLNRFTAWRVDGCDECGRYTLVTGVPSGPVRCRACWVSDGPQDPPPGGEPDPNQQALFEET